ncbi:MAG: hypothetical protein QOI44_2217 [Actinomycetota bacterium]|jgi:hypothetical protein|nr:hypothetical protein [Actinomycetota bacterium]
MVVERTRKRSATTLAGIAMILVGMFSIVLAGLGVSIAGATKPNPEHKITLCHRTDSRSNPYVTESVDVASALFEGHDGHNGPVFSPDLPQHEKWGDIIPAFDFGPGEQYAGKNLPAGQAILDNGCVLPGTTTTSASTTTGPPNVTTPSTEGTTTSTSVETIVTDFGTTTTTTPVGRLGTPGDPPGTGTGSPILALTGSPAAALFGIGLVLVASGIGLAVRRRNWAR